MTAWQRWELADFSDKPAPAKQVVRQVERPQPKAPPPLPPPPPPPPPAEPVVEYEPEPAQATFKFPTLEELEQIHQQAQRDGYNAGYEEGAAQARQEAARFAELANSLENALSNLDKEVAEELMRLAMEIARQVVRQQVAAKPEMILTVVKEAMLQLPHQHASIFLHPDDATFVRGHLGEQLSHAGHRILEEPRMERGGCKVEAAGCQIDAGVEMRWRRVLAGMGKTDEWIEASEEGQ